MQGLWDEALAELLHRHPAALDRLTRLTIRGSHRGDIALTQRSVQAVRARAAGLQQLGDCYTWSLGGTGPHLRSPSGRGLL